MLGLILIYWIGKYHYLLAEKFNKNKWLFAILGVVSYYGGIFVGGILLVILFEVFSPGSIDSMSDMAIGLMALPFGLLTTYGLYMLLKSIWTKNQRVEEVSIDDIGKS